MVTHLGEGHSELKRGLRGVAPHSPQSSGIVKPTMENKVIPNPILPAAGVRSNFAAGPPSGGHHDDRTSNPRGRVLSDHSTPSNALMRCRRPFVMGTFNACTAREEVRLVELADCAEERGVEILGIQEHRSVHTDDRIMYRRVERCTFISASAW